MIEKKTWKEFQDSKMLWLINRTLHLFGWAIVLDCEIEDGKVVEVTGAYPARVKFRGFDYKTEEEGFIGLSEYMKENADQLIKEAKE